MAGDELVLDIKIRKMSEKYIREGSFYCHKCKQYVDIYPYSISPGCLRFQIHNDEICKHYKLLNNADAEFLNKSGNWKKYEYYSPLSAGILYAVAGPFLGTMVNNFDQIKPFSSIMKDKENEKQYFQCMNCRHQSKNFYDFIPYC